MSEICDFGSLCGTKLVLLYKGQIRTHATTNQVKYVVDSEEHCNEGDHYCEESGNNA